jgi:hypothetical protein
LKYFNDLLRLAFPKIRVHTWGGYGSQLYGLYLYLELERQFPYRRIQIVVHTSGVTERFSEIDQYTSINSIEVRDYKSGSQSSASAPRTGNFTILPRIRKLFRCVVKVTGFLSDSNSRSEFENIKPWVLSLRGHYTKIHFNSDSLLRLYKLIEADTSITFTNDHYIGIQYRLGDLVALKNKFPTNPEAIVACIQNINDQSVNEIKLHSDSLDVALRLLRPLIPEGLDLEAVPANPMETIILLSNSSYFIGTTSKISVWVAIFRNILIQNPNTYMKVSFRRQLEEHGINQGVHYY